MAREIAGWFTFYCLLWLCWALGAPIVKDAARQPVSVGAPCPYLVIQHGVGSDLRTFTRAFDLCEN